MDEQDYPAQNVARQAQGGIDKIMRDDVTVRENIDAKIARLQAQIADLEASKAELGPILDMRIDRLRRAMNG